MTVKASIRFAFAAALAGSEAFAGGPNWNAMIEEAMTFEDGTGAGQADRFYIGERTVNSASNDDMDLAGVLADPLGTTFTAAEIVALLILNKRKDGSANTTNLTLGVGSNPVTGYMGGTTPTFGPIRPGGFLFFGGPDAGGFGIITPSTGDILRIANSSGAQAKYQIALLARSA